MSKLHTVRSWFRRPRVKKSDWPDFYKDYLLDFGIPIEKNTLLADLEYAVVDTEATGLDVKIDEIVSFGGVILHDKAIEIQNSLSIYIAGRKVRDRKALEIHGLLPNELEAVDELEALKRFLIFIKNRVLVGHYVGFDLKMINNLLHKYKCGPLNNNVLDTAEFAKRLDFPMRNYQFAINKNYTLDALCAKYGVIPKARHTAAGDAYITAILFQKLLSDLSKKGVKKFGDIL